MVGVDNMSKTQKKHIINRIILLSMPIAAGVIFDFIIERYMHYNIKDVDIRGLAETTLGILATFLGFIITAESILIAFDGSKLTKEIKETGHFKTVLTIYSVTCIFLLVSMLYVYYMAFGFWICKILILIFVGIIIASCGYILLCIIFLILLINTIFLP